MMRQTALRPGQCEAGFHGARGWTTDRLSGNRPPVALKGVSSPDMSHAELPSPLHLRARRSFEAVTVRGITLFAAPNAASVVDLLADAPGILVAINADKLARADAELGRLTRLHFGYPDGIGAVLALRRLGHHATRLPGVELWLDVVERFAGRRSFLLVGGTASVVSTVAEKLRRQFPAIRLRYRDGYLSPTEEDELLADLVRHRPEIVFVAMGSPRQERLMLRMHAVHPVTYLGLGGSLDVYSGRVPRAPRWMQRLGLEGAFRVAREPRRWRRLPAYVKFTALLAARRLS